MKTLLLVSGLMIVPAVALAKVEVQGHRGARAMRPENTIAAFEYALGLGVDTLELDLGVTKDNEVVIAHDPFINGDLCVGPEGKKVSEKIPLRSLTLREVKEFDCGSTKNPRFPDQVPVPGARIPTLDELFRMVQTKTTDEAKNVMFNIEMKVVPRVTGTKIAGIDEFARLVVDIVVKHHLEKRVMVQSFDARALAAVRKLEPKIALVQLLSENYLEPAAILRGGRVEVISPNLNWITPEFVKKAHAARVRVVPWTANTKEDWDWLMSCGVDGIITDDPAALLAHLKEPVKKASGKK